MLVHDFLYVPLAADRVRDQILSGRGEWLSPLAVAAAREGEALRLRVGPALTLPLLSKTVTVETGDPLVRGDVAVVPIIWRAIGAPGLFPVLAADLEVARLDPQLTQLTLRGRYEPPLGGLSERL